MVSRKTVHNVVGIIGNVVSCGLFLSPVPTFYFIFKKKAVEGFQPYPYLCTFMNCLFWTFYGLPIVKKDSILVLTINSIGVVIELIYLAMYWTYTDKKNRIRVLLFLLGEGIFFGVIVLIGMLVFDFSKRSTFVGVICDVFNIMMYASPLAVWKKVIQTKSVEFMPFWLSMANFANGVIWTCYSLIIFDAFILICNSIGTFFGLIQLIVYACYYPTTPKKNKEAAKPPEIEVTAWNSFA